MSELFYRNLPGVNSDTQAQKLMHLTYESLEPYFNYFHKCRKKIEQKTIEMTLVKVDLEEIISEEISVIKSELVDEELSFEEIESTLNFEIYLDKRLIKFAKKVRKEKFFVYQIVEKDDESFAKEKESFLNSEEVYFHKKFSNNKCRIVGIYEPYNLVALDRVSKEFKNKEQITVYARASMYVLDMISKSLRFLQDKPQAHNRNLIKLFEDKKYVNFADTILTKFVEDDEWLFLTELGRKGTKEQRDFVNIALTTSDFAILEGPPGSGKTTTICEIIYQGIKRGKRILLVASTHVAVDNVLEKLFDEEKDYYNKVKETILPIRIGKQDNWKISELASQFQFENFWEEEKNRLITSLTKLKVKTPAQEAFLSLLKQKEKSKFVSKSFLNAANLVCGTTIGILMHPELRKVRSKEAITRPFDMLILDEASKTTFQEFLVPALAAKTFIIVGDVMQLPPYVEEEGVSSNLEFLSENKNHDLVNLHFNLDSIYKRHLKIPKRCLIITKNTNDYQRYKLLEQYYDRSIAFLYEEDETIDLATLWGAEFIIGTEGAIKKHQAILPISLSFVKENSNDLLKPIDFKELRLEHFQFTNNYFKDKFLKEQSINFRRQDESWAHGISWRLNRSFEHRFLQENFYDLEIEKRLPKWLEEDELNEIKFFLEDIKKISYPSVIELLQKGFKRKYRKENTVLTEGFNERDLKLRHRKLIYQHRMHPDISAFSRENFYDKKALLDFPGIEGERAHTIRDYQYHLYWVDVKVPSRYKSRNVNLNKYEIKAILQELGYLEKWLINNPKPKNRFWTIAILPFYKAQENLLREQLRKKFKSKRFRTFVDRKNRIRIELCVIDRFQGHEADFVFLSMVQNRRVGFLDCPNRLNVALTRGKYQVLIVGDNKFFASENHRSDILRKLARTTKCLKRIYKYGS